MFYINYYSHLILHSKYKFILFLLFYFLLIYLHGLNYVYCLEEDSNQLTLTQKLTGSGLFIGSIALMLFLQKFTGGSGSDSSTLIDMTTQLAMQGTLHTTPEFLDYFTLTKDGKLYINNLNIDTHNIYLNANEVIRQIQLDDKYKQILTETFHRLQNFYTRCHIPTQDINSLEQMLPNHLEHMNNLLINYVQQTLVVAYYTNFINALETIGAIDPNYGLLLNEFITNGGQPDQFYNFLVAKLQQRR